MVQSYDFHSASEAKRKVLSSGFLSGDTDLLQEQKVTHVIDDVGQPDPHGGTGDTHCPDKQSRLCFLISKDMLDTRLDDGLAYIRPLDMPWHELEMQFFPVNLPISFF